MGNDSWAYFAFYTVACVFVLSLVVSLRRHDRRH